MSWSEAFYNLSNQNWILILWKVKNARRVTKFMWPLKPVPGRARGQLILNSRVPLYQVTFERRVLDRAKTKVSTAENHATRARRFLASSHCCIRAFEQKLYYSTFIFLYGWNKTFKILALVPNDLFKGKHICRAVIKVSPGHLSEPLGCKMDILYLRSLSKNWGQLLSVSQCVCISEVSRAAKQMSHSREIPITFGSSAKTGH